MHLLREEGAARREDAGNLAGVERSVPVQHQVELAIGEGHGRRLGERRSDDRGPRG